MKPVGVLGWAVAAVLEIALGLVVTELVALDDLSRLVLAAGLVTSAMAASLIPAVVLSVSDEHAHARRLALGLWGGVVWFLIAVAPRLLGPEAGWTAAVSGVPGSASLGLFGLATGLTSLARFAHAYPRSVTLADSVSSRLLWSPLTARRAGPPKHRSFLARPVIDPAGVARPLLTMVWSPWIWPAALLVSMTAALGGVAGTLATLLVITAGGTSILHGAWANYLSASPEERDRVLWISLSLGIGIPVWTLATVFALAASLVVDLIVGAAGGLSEIDTVLFAWPASVALLPATWFALGCLVIGLFFHGALDPRLAVRRTVVVGGAGFFMAFLFGVVEAALSDLFLSRLGIPEGAGAWIAGGVAAVSFGPLRDMLDRRLGTKVTSGLTTDP